jgi:hypothetical protein
MHFICINTLFTQHYCIGIRYHFVVYVIIFVYLMPNQFVSIFINYILLRTNLYLFYFCFLQYLATIIVTLAMAKLDIINQLHWDYYNKQQYNTSFNSYYK